ncbi:MAG: hypothetical protein AAGB31_11250 [Bdellovibrio sp.]
MKKLGNLKSLISMGLIMITSVAALAHHPGRNRGEANILTVEKMTPVGYANGMLLSSDYYCRNGLQSVTNVGIKGEQGFFSLTGYCVEEGFHTNLFLKARTNLSPGYYQAGVYCLKPGGGRYPIRALLNSISTDKIILELNDLDDEQKECGGDEKKSVNIRINY